MNKESFGMSIKSYVKYIFMRSVQWITKCIWIEQSLGSDVRKILLVRLDDIGDMVMTSSFIRELRRNYPNAYIEIVVKQGTYDLVKYCPYVNHVRVFDGKTSSFMPYFKNIFKAFKFSYKYLKKQHFDLAILPRWDSDAYYASWIVFFSAARMRVAYSEKVNPQKTVSNLGYDAFFTDVVETGAKHEVERNLYIVEYLGGKIYSTNLELWINRKKFLLKRYFRKKHIRLCIFLSASDARREWGVNNFVDLAKLLSKQYNIEIILLGSYSNTYLQSTEFEKKYGVVSNYVGKTTLEETMYIISECDFCVGVDTGPMHIADACNRCGVVIFPSLVIENGSPPERFGPWNSNLVVCQPRHYLSGCENGCNKPYPHCIKEVTVEDVYNEMKKIIEKWKENNYKRMNMIDK